MGRDTALHKIRRQCNNQRHHNHRRLASTSPSSTNNLRRNTPIDNGRATTTKTTTQQQQHHPNERDGTSANVAKAAVKQRTNRLPWGVSRRPPIRNAKPMPTSTSSSSIILPSSQPTFTISIDHDYTIGAQLPRVCNLQG